MTPTEFVRSIRKVRIFLEDFVILGSYGPQVSLNVSREFREASLSDTTTYADVYRCGLRNLDYNFLLTDRSYLQFTYRTQEAWRLAFYPNPFIHISSAELTDIERRLALGELQTEEYDQAISEFEAEIGIPPIRYDLDFEQYEKLLHPASHFHIGHNSDDRWPVARRLTPHAFSLLVARLYFGNRWTEAGELVQPDDGFSNRFDVDLAKARMDCRRMATAVFSAEEERLPYFA